mgnify:CR=1 FL=1
MIELCAFADEAGSGLKEQISALKENGIGYIELRSINGKNVLSFTDDEVKKYSEELKNAGIKVWSIGSPVGKIDISVTEEDFLKDVSRAIEIAKGFGAKRIRIFSFFNAYSSCRKVVGLLQKAVEIADENGVKLCHENEKEVYGDSIERVLDLFAAVQGLNFVYDPANYIQCGFNAREAREKTQFCTDYYHIKDVIKNTGEIVPAGLGDGDISGLIDSLDGKNAVLTLEPHLKVFDGYAKIDGTEMKNKFNFNTNREAFDCAVKSLKKLLVEKGYKETETGYTK